MSCPTNGHICIECNKRYTRKSSLIRHCKKHKIKIIVHPKTTLVSSSNSSHSYSHSHTHSLLLPHFLPLSVSYEANVALNIDFEDKLNHYFLKNDFYERLTHLCGAGVKTDEFILLNINNPAKIIKKLLEKESLQPFASSNSSCRYFNSNGIAINDPTDDKLIHLLIDRITNCSIHAVNQLIFSKQKTGNIELLYTQYDIGKMQSGIHDILSCSQNQKKMLNELRTLIYMPNHPLFTSACYGAMFNN